MFTVVSSFQSTVALHKTPLYILHYEASEEVPFHILIRALRARAVRREQ